MSLHWYSEYWFPGIFCLSSHCVFIVYPPVYLCKNNQLITSVPFLHTLSLSLSLSLSPPLCPDLYAACEAGDLAKVREHLQVMPEAINEFIQDGNNLLMWWANRTTFPAVFPHFCIDIATACVSGQNTDLILFTLHHLQGVFDKYIL